METQNGTAQHPVYQKAWEIFIDTMQRGDPSRPEIKPARRRVLGVAGALCAFVAATLFFVMTRDLTPTLDALVRNWLAVILLLALICLWCVGFAVQWADSHKHNREYEVFISSMILTTAGILLLSISLTLRAAVT